jgi:hypothetical protein
MPPGSAQETGADNQRVEAAGLSGLGGNRMRVVTKGEGSE